MKNTRQVYVLMLNARSRKTVRLWTGASIYSLQHYSSKKIDRTLAEMQQHVDDLQRAIRVLATGGSYSINRARYCAAAGGTHSPRKRTANMPDDARDKKIHVAAKPAEAPSRIPAEGDLTCSEFQIEDILAEGESSRPMSKSDKGLHPKRQPKSSRVSSMG